MTENLVYMFFICIVIFILSVTIMLILRYLPGMEVKWFHVMFFVSLFTTVASAIVALFCYIRSFYNHWELTIAFNLFQFVFLPAVIMLVVSVLIYYVNKKSREKKS